jgi:GNAT superfamily N-acetyltransferase
VKFSPVESLTRAHELDTFDCGSLAQTDWLRRHASQAHASGTSRVYVVRELSTNRVVGYYALAAGSVAPADAPRRLLRGAGGYDQPVILLTRLGVDLGAQRFGLGRALVVDALRRVKATADQIGVRALLIHCESDAARAFYEKLARFDESPTDPLHLLLMIKDLRKSAG